MSEENKETQEVVEQPQTEQVAQTTEESVLSPSEQEFLQKVELSPFMASNPEVQEKIEQIKAKQKETPQPKDNRNEEVSQENDKEDSEGDSKKSKAESKISSFFDQKKNVEVEFTEDLTNFIKNKYSIEDPNTFINSVDNWRKDAQKKSELEKEYNAVTDYFASLPEGLTNVLEAYGKGEDWQSVAKQSLETIDYSQPFERQSSEDVVKKYFPEYYETQKKALEGGDIDEVEMQEQLARITPSAKKLFEEERKRIEEEKQNILQTQQQQIESLRESAKSSLESFRNENPIFGEKSYRSKLDKIYNDLDNGDISKHFVNKDGTWKGDAVEKLFFALYGKEEGQKAVENARKEGASQGAMDVVDRGNRKPNVKSSQVQGMSEEQLLKQTAGRSFVGSTLGRKNPFAPKRQ